MRVAFLAKAIVFARLVMALVVVVTTLGPSLAKAAERRVLIHDAEVETTIRSLATPLFQAAGLAPEAVRIYLVQDDTLNAFVIGGQNIFLHTGLLLRTETPEQLAGVIAHETGHIAGGHLVRTGEAVRGASNIALLSFILGAATIVATGRGDAAAAIIAGGQNIAGKTFMSFSRAQESAADQAAVKLLDQTSITSVGLFEFLKTLQGQELLVAERRSAYAGTHPLTRERISFLSEHVNTSPIAPNRLPKDAADKHDRLLAKLFSFVRPPIHTFRQYPVSDTSLPARYARAIATYRRTETDAAIGLIDELLSEAPEDAYFHELRGQVLFESGRIVEAEASYRQAFMRLPEQPLIAMGLAQTILSRPDRSGAAEAEDLLEHALRDRPATPFAWRQLAIARGRAGNKPMAALALAEEAIRTGQVRDAVGQAKRAQAGLANGSAGWLRAVDIEELAKRQIQARGQTK